MRNTTGTTPAPLMTPPRTAVLYGVMLGKPEEMAFMPNRDYVACCVCGEVFQHWLSRVDENEYTNEVRLAAEIKRREWTQIHSRTHSEAQHRQLALSGRQFTPEATYKLCSLGLIPLSDIVMSDEHAQAGLESRRMPINDVEGS